MSTLDVSPACFDKPKEIFMVGQAFKSCNPEMLLEVLLDCEAQWKIPFKEIGDSASSHLLNKIRSTLTLMNSIYEKNPEFEEPFAQNELIIPLEVFNVEDEFSMIKRTIEAKIFHLAYLEECSKRLGDSTCKPCTQEEFETIRCNMDIPDPLNDALDKGTIDPIYALIDEAWTTALRRNVLLPESLCEREKYCVLASIFWMLTFNGFLPQQSIPYTFLGNLAEDLIDAEYPDEEIPESFYADYNAKLNNLVDLLNFNSWSESIRSIDRVCSE